MSIFLLIWFLPLLISGKSIYDFKLKDISGNEVDFKQFKGKTLLILNTASQCSHTDSTYKSLIRLHSILNSKNNFEILAFPCNDFGEQEPWEEREIEEFVRGHFKAEFLLFPKTQILKNRSEFWDFIISQSSTTPTWNFQKYLFSPSGSFIASWDSNTNIESIFSTIKETMEKKEIVVNKSEL